jgi:rhodanese-related sulfurtransferase
MQLVRFVAALPTLLAFTTAAPLNAAADGLDGNRYSDTLERRYAADISASAAYLATNPPKGFGRGQSAVIIDVRTVEEFVGGHPPGAISIPFPHIHNRQYSDPADPNHDLYIGQDPADFVAAVDDLGLSADTLIITMCRTGFRSVLAGNLLADAGYTNVQNMWEGFKGRLKQNVAGEDVDLDGDGFVDGSDPYSGDLDGWANFAKLPVSFKLRPWQIYPDPDYQYRYLYYSVEGER